MEIFNTFVNQLDYEKLSVGCFQQDGATSHNSHASMAEIQSFFGDRVIYIYVYTECPRRNVPDFGRMFLMLKYTDITQNTYVQS